MLSEIVDEAQERIQSLLSPRDGPLLELVYFSGHRLLSFSATDDSPHGKLGLVELPFRQLKLEPIRLGNLADLIHFIDMRLEAKS